MNFPLRTILASLCVTFILGCGEDSTSPPAPQPLVYTKSDHGIPWVPPAVHGVMQDSRDGQLYRTVLIGKKTWFAENLDYRRPGSDSGSCHNASADSCSKYGRLYTWAAAMDGATSSIHAPSGVRGVCPAGWHLPSITEWDTLVAIVERNPRVGTAMGGIALRATAGWKAGSGTPGIDLVGFRGLASGYRYTNGSYMYLGEGGGWWTFTASSATEAYRRDLGRDYNGVFRGSYDMNGGFSVRCVQD